MNELRPEAMESQILRMKQDVLRLKRLWLLTLVVPVLMALVGFQPGGSDKVIEGTEFVLRDKNKKTVARLFTGDDGLPVLAFYDKDGTNGVRLGYEPGGRMGLLVLDKTGVTNVWLGTHVTLSSNLQLSQPGGKRINQFVFKDETRSVASLTMGDVEGPEELAINNDHELEKDHKWSVISFVGDAADGDKLGALSLLLESDNRTGSSIILHDKKENERLILSADPAGKPSIRLLDDKQKPIGSLPSP